MSALAIIQKIYERINDLFTGSTSGNNKTQIVDENNNTVSAQYPFATDGDSVYAKDIQIDDSDIGDFTGVITGLVDDYRTAQVAASVVAGGANHK